jgi:hypothetical protein
MTNMNKKDASKATKKVDELNTPYDTESEESFDAKVMEEEIEMGDLEAPPANPEGDYEASKEFSEPDTDPEEKVNSL